MSNVTEHPATEQAVVRKHDFCIIKSEGSRSVGRTGNGAQSEEGCPTGHPLRAFQ
jgi:hypothetical protein